MHTMVIIIIITLIAKTRQKTFYYVSYLSKTISILSSLRYYIEIFDIISFIGTPFTLKVTFHFILIKNKQ